MDDLHIGSDFGGSILTWSNRSLIENPNNDDHFNHLRCERENESKTSQILRPAALAAPVAKGSTAEKNRCAAAGQPADRRTAAGPAATGRPAEADSTAATDRTAAGLAEGTAIFNSTTDLSYA